MKRKEVILTNKGIVLKNNLLNYIRGNISVKDIILPELQRYIVSKQDASSCVGIVYGYCSGKIYKEIPNYRIRQLGLDVRHVKIILKFLTA